MVTTKDAHGNVNVAPMGPHVDDESLQTFHLKPFRSSRTFQNLAAAPQGVFHITDDVYLLAQAVANRWSESPAFVAASEFPILADACRWYAFTATEIPNDTPRSDFHCQVQQSGRLRDFVGFHRARHAVLEAAILATRVHLIPVDEIWGEFERLEVLVQKTASPRETTAFELLKEYIQDNANSAR